MMKVYIAYVEKVVRKEILLQADNQDGALEQVDYLIDNSTFMETAEAQPAKHYTKIELVEMKPKRKKVFKRYK